MSTPHPLPPKKEVALALLERSNDRGIFVHLDPRQAGVFATSSGFGPKLAAMVGQALTLAGWTAPAQ